MSVEHDGPSPERYRALREPCSSDFGRELAQISGDIDDPVVKLRYLRGAIDRSDRYQRRVEHVPSTPVRRALYRLRGLEALDSVVEDGGHSPPPHVQARTLTARRRARRIVAGSTAAALLLVPALLVGLALQSDTKESMPTATQPLSLPASTEMLTTAPPSAFIAESESTRVIAETLPDDMLGVLPTTIWLADRGEGWELYSNGLRIETAYSVAGEPRNYRVHDRKRGLQAQVQTRPVGILFHTSESDLWPLSAEYEKQLRRSSTNLLRYVRNTQAYNYLIDRFGRVYRIVDDDTRASHAGHGVWANGDDVYLDLNGAFLGVSFESRWEGGRTLPITRAQLIAGRNLTHYLRQRFAIAPEMCVTHGLASVSPRRHLIGYHRDWARGFPFAAFGLPDLYAHPPPSVALFGFGYDAAFVRAIGEPWPGLAAANDTLEQAAREQGVTPDALRQERRALYRQWSGQVRAGEAPADEVKVENTARESEATSHGHVQHTRG
jgi:hypothetical protein